MAVAVLVLALVAWAYAMVAYPEFRRAGSIMAILAASGLTILLLQGPGESESQRIEPEELVLDRIEVEPTLRGATLSGRVENRSAAYRLREMTLDLSLHDCLAVETPVAECPVIGEGTAIARPDVPPGQIRAFSAHFLLANLPEVAGVLRWDWSVTATRATD
jgi:hypothetical protein